MLDDLKYIAQKDPHDLLGHYLRQLRGSEYAEYEHEWAPDVPASANYAKQLALEMMGRAVAIVATESNVQLATHWQSQLGLHAQCIAFTQIIPENIDVLVRAWSGVPNIRPFSVVQLHATLEDNESALFDVINNRLSGHWPEPLIVNGSAEYMQQLAYVVSVYLAVANNVSPYHE